MKPRASAPRTRSGLRGAAHSVSASTVARSASASASSGMMSLKTIPGLGKSGTSRIFDFNSIAMVGRGLRLSRGERAQLTPEEELGQLLREGGEGLEILEPGPAPLGVPRAESRSD